MKATRSKRRGWMLLEMLVALTIFVFTALAVLGSIGQAIASAERTRDRMLAADLARSTMARLEAGLGTIQNLAGPVPPWEPPLVTDGPFDESLSGNFSESLPEPSLWEVEIDTLPSEFAGLTHVIVTAVKRPSVDSDRVVASYTLHQFVRIGSGPEESGGAAGMPTDPAESVSPSGALR